MGRPLLFIDFDGVINQFPDDKVMRRQGRTGWMRPDDPHRAAYAPDNWFRPDRRERLLVRDLGRRFVIRWNAELVARLDALDADKWWLTTWQPETGRLNRALGVDWPTIRWYDPITRDGIPTGKRRTILDALKQDRPIVWLDDARRPPTMRGSPSRPRRTRLPCLASVRIPRSGSAVPRWTSSRISSTTRPPAPSYGSRRPATGTRAIGGSDA